MAIEKANKSKNLTEIMVASGIATTASFSVDLSGNDPQIYSLDV